MNQGRATYARLDEIRGPEDAAADIIDLWIPAETAMRAMLGGSVLSGQPLVHELRQRGVITLEQANALASFWDARARVDDIGYKPTLTDVGYVRAGYNALSKALQDSASNKLSPPLPHPVQPILLASSPAHDEPAEHEDGGDYDAPAHRLSTPAIAGIVTTIFVLALIAVYLVIRGSSYDKQMASAIDLMRTGQTESARAQFVRVAQDHPDQSDPHVFLSRLSRNDGDIAVAHQELDTAIRLNPSSSTALREMGILLLTEKNPDLARRFLIRAIKIAPTDLSAQGYLGCALLQLHRTDEAQSFFSRAGAGSWTSCATLPAPSSSAPH